jgi:glycosyltransferase involved in cell wall biosynthesis
VRVLVVSHLYPSPGVERHLFVHEQILALRELGVEARVLSPTPWVPRVLWRDPRHRRRGQKPRRAVRDGVAAEYPRVLQPPRRLLFDRLGDLAYHRLRRLPSLRAGGYDLVHAHQALPDGALAQRLAADLGVPCVVTVHGADVYQHFRLGGAVERRARAVLAGAGAVMANSSAVARLLDGVVAPERLAVVLNGTTGLERVVEPATDYLPGEPLILTTGYLIERKGMAELIDALALLRRDGRGARLAVVGDGPLRADLGKRAADRGVADAVEFLGRLPHARVLALMARCQVFALPSWDEAFGLVYTEAMAQGTPIVAGRGEGPEDFIDDGVSGYLVPVRDAEALAAVLARILGDPQAAAAVGRAGKAAAAALSWERNARLTHDVYGRVLGEAHGGAQAAPEAEAPGGGMPTEAGRPGEGGPR